MLMSHSHHIKSGKNLKIAILLNFAFFVVELICGNIFNSKIILADALHDLGDVLLLSTSLIFDKISRKKPNSKYSYGFRRLVVFGAILNSVVLLVGVSQMIRWIYYEIAFPHKHPFVNIPGLAIVSVLGIVVNLVAAWRVHGSKNILDRTVFVHLLEDLLGWIMAFLSSILIWVTGFHQIDRVMSLVILLMVAWSAIDVVVKSVKVLLNSAPSVKDFEKLEKQILVLEGVLEIENSHFWSLDGEQNIYTARIFIKKGAKIPDLRKEISKIVANHGVVDSTIEFFEK